MKMQGIRKSFWTRLVAAMISYVFLFYSPVIAVSAPAASAGMVDPASVVVPENLGQVKEVFTSGSGKLVIHIQDAHMNYGVQKNIDEIIQTLVSQYAVNMISVEGGIGDIDVAGQKGTLDMPMRDAVADYMVKEGYFSGAKAAAYKMEKPVSFYGAEKGELYNANVDVFKSVYKVKDQSLAFTGYAAGQLETLTEKLLTGESKDFVGKTMDYRARRLDFSSYASFLAGVAKKQGLNTEGSKNFTKLMSSLALQESIDYAAVETERAALLKVLEPAMTAEATKKLVDESLSYRMGKLSGLEYYTGLKAAAEKAKVGIDGYKNVVNYMNLLTLRAGTDNAALFAEAEAIETQLAGKVLSGSAKTVYDLRRWADVLGKYPVFQLTRADYEYYAGVKGQITLDAFVSFLKGNGVAVSDEVLANGKVLFGNLGQMEKFYVLAAERDRAIVANTLGAMDAKKTNTAVLVSGGYHSEGIKAELKKAGVSYIEISPRVTTRTDNDLYVRLMTGTKTGPDGVFIYKFLAFAQETPAGDALRTDLTGALTAFKAWLGSHDKAQLAGMDDAALIAALKANGFNGPAAGTTLGAWVMEDASVALAYGAKAAVAAAKAQGVQVGKAGVTAGSTAGEVAGALSAALAAVGVAADAAAVQAAVQALDATQLQALALALSEGFLSVSGEAARAFVAAADRGKAEGAKALNTKVDGNRLLLLFNAGVTDVIHELIEGSTNHAVAANAQAAADVAIKASNFAAALTLAQAQVKAAGEDASAIETALNTLLDNDGMTDATTKDAIKGVIGDVIQRVGAKGAAENKDINTRIVSELRAIGNTLNTADARFNTVRTWMGGVASEKGAWAANLSEQAIKDQNLYLSVAAAKAMQAQGGMAAAVADVFTKMGRVLDAPKEGVLIAMTENDAAATAQGVRVELMDQLDLTNLAMFERVALSAKTPGQIREAFFAMSPVMQTLLRASYGDALMGILNNSNTQFSNLNPDIANSALVNMRLNSELAAAIKA